MHVIGPMIVKGPNLTNANGGKTPCRTCPFVDIMKYTIVEELAIS